MPELLFMAYPCILVVVKRDDRSPNRGARHFEACMTIFDLYGSGSGEGISTCLLSRQLPYMEGLC